MLRATSLALALAVAACANTMYIPQTPGAVAMTIVDNKQVYVRDGQAYPDGVLGGGLVDAVAGNPAAVQAAQTYHSRKSTGLILAVIGLVAEACALGALPYAAFDANNNNDAETILAIAAGGVVLALIGATEATSAEGYRWDAINMFNDGALRRGPMLAPPMPRPPMGPPIAPPGAVQSLQMRQ